MTRRARHAPVPVVLQSAADRVRVFEVGADLVELADRQVVAEEPRLPAVPRDRDAAVAADDQMIRIVRIDPERVIFGVDRAEHVAKVSSTVVRDVEPAVRSEEVDAVAILRIDPNLAVVHRTRIHRRQLVPRVAAIHAAVDAALATGGFDDRVDQPSVAAEDVEADASFLALREPRRQRRPRRAAVDGAVDAAARSAAVESPGFALALIGRGEQDLGVLWIHGEIGRAGVLVDEQHLVPGLAAVDRLEYAALGVRTPQMADGGNVHDIGVARMNDDAPDVTRFFEARGSPGATRVERLVDAVAPRGALPIVRLTGAGPHDAAVGRRDGDVADRHHRVNAIEDWRPRCALICALEHAAARRGDVDRVGRPWRPRNREIIDAASGVRGSDAPPAQIVQQRRIERAWRVADRAGDQNRAREHHEEKPHRRSICRVLPSGRMHARARGSREDSESSSARSATRAGVPASR